MNSLNKNNIYLLSISICMLFLLLLIILNITQIPCVVATSGQTVFISDTKYESKGYFAYELDFKEDDALKSNNLREITIFFSNEKRYLTIFFPNWNDNKLLIEENINSNTYLNQTVLIIIGKESLLSFIWNNITT